MDGSSFGSHCLARVIACALLAASGGACGAEQPAAEVPRHPRPATTPAPAITPAAVVEEPDAAPKPALLELQKKAIRGMVAAFNAHDPKALAAFYSPNALVRSPSRDGWKDETGRAPIEKGHAGLFAAFPDVKIATRVVYVSGEVAVWTWISGGTDSVGLGGEPPTKAQFGFKGASVLSFGADGLIAEDHTYFDPRTMMGQLGKLPKGTKVRSVLEVPDGELWWREAKGDAAERKGIDTLQGVYDALVRGDQKAFLAPLDDKGQYVLMSAAKSTAKVEAKAEFAAFRKAFSNPKLVSSRVWGIDLEVISETTLTATHSARAGAPARPVTLHFLDIASMTRDGQWILEADTYDNRAELLAQVPPAKQ